MEKERSMRTRTKMMMMMMMMMMRRRTRNFGERRKKYAMDANTYLLVYNKASV
jgi:hypothetical protein